MVGGANGGHCHGSRKKKRRDAPGELVEQILTIPGVGGDDQLNDDGGDASLVIHEGTELEAAFAVDRKHHEPRV